MLTTLLIKLGLLFWWLVRTPYYLFILLFIPKEKRRGNEVEELLSIKNIFTS